MMKNRIEMNDRKLEMVNGGKLTSEAKAWFYQVFLPAHENELASNKLLRRNIFREFYGMEVSKDEFRNDLFEDVLNSHIKVGY